MKTLITPSEVLRRAFRSRERLPADTVTEADIATAEARFLCPVLGQALHDRLLLGNDATFVAAYLADAVALLSRYVASPRLRSFCSAMGSFRPEPPDTAVQDAAVFACEQRALKREAMTLLRHATDYLEQHAADFPEYEPNRNILNRCTTDGGFVQIF